MARIAPHFLLAGLFLALSTACWTQSESGTPVAATDEEAAQEVRPERVRLERVRIGGVQWYIDYDAALAVAREQEKALWVHFGENPG